MSYLQASATVVYASHWDGSVSSGLKVSTLLLSFPAHVQYIIRYLYVHAAPFIRFPSKFTS